MLSLILFILLVFLSPVLFVLLTSLGIFPTYLSNLVASAFTAWKGEAIREAKAPLREPNEKALWKKENENIPQLLEKPKSL